MSGFSWTVHVRRKSHPILNVPGARRPPPTNGLSSSTMANCGDEDAPKPVNGVRERLAFCLWLNIQKLKVSSSLHTLIPLWK